MRTNWSPCWRPVPNIRYLHLKLLADLVYMFLSVAVSRYMSGKPKTFAPD